MKIDLAKLDVNNSNTIKNALTVIARRLANRDEDEEADNAIATLQSVLNNQEFNPSQQTRLASYEKFCDEEFLSGYINDIETTINNPLAADQAMMYYDVAWFKSHPVSPRGKILLCATLVRLCQKQKRNINNFWLLLSDDDPIMQDITSFDIVNSEDNS